MDLANADFSTFAQHLAGWTAAALPNLLAGIVLLTVGWWFAGWAERTTGSLLEHQHRIDPTLRGVAAPLVRYAILALVLVTVLGQFGVQTTSILAVLGAAGLAIGLALQGTLANIAAGVMLLWLRPFKVGDSIEADGIAGTLTEVGLFASHIHTGDGVFQFVPNNQLWNKRIINYSRLPTRLVDLKFRIAYADSIARARQVLMTLATNDARVNKAPPPEVSVVEFADSAVVLALRAWTSTPDHGNVRNALIEGGKTALEDAGLTMPVPQRDVRLVRAPGSANGREP